MVDQFARGGLDESKTYDVLPSSTAVMKLIGLPDLPIRAGVHALDAVYNHGVKPSQMKQILDELANPPLVMIWNKGANGVPSLNVVTSMSNNDGEPFVIALHPSKASRQGKHHYLATITQKQPRAILDMVREGGALYVGGGEIAGIKDAELQAASRFAKEKRGKEARDLKDVIASRDDLPNLVRNVLYSKDLERFKSGQSGVGQTRERNSCASIAIWSRSWRRRPAPMAARCNSMRCFHELHAVLRSSSRKQDIPTVGIKRKKRCNFDSCSALHSLVGRAGVEPTTNGLKVRCSTN